VVRKKATALWPYTLLGGFFGALGQSVSLMGFQQGLSILTGVIILAVFLFSRRLMLLAHVAKSVAFLKQKLRIFLQRPGATGSLGLGVLNGLLPCGLVYTACAGAASTGHVLSGAVAMLLFGVGTIPMMLAVATLGSRLQTRLRLRFQQLIPFCVIGVALLLIVRGLGLGIPYLSPDPVTKSCCPVRQ
jgi:uncharacterized protein